MAHKSTTTRVSPSVKSQAITNRRDLRNWELRFGLIPLVCFLGLVCAGIAGGFYLGYKTGQSIGHDSAQTANLQNEARMPVAGVGDGGDEAMPDLYAKLSQKKSIKVEESDSGAASDLSAVKTIEESPPLFPPSEGGALGEPQKESESVKDEALKADLGSSTSEESGSKEKLAALEKAMGNPLDPKAQAAIELDSDASNKAPPAKIASLAEEAKPAAEAVVKKSEPPAEKVALKTVAEPVKPVEAVKTQENKLEAPAAREAAKKEPEAPKAASALIKKNLSKGWYAQVAAPKKLKDAEDAAKRLKSSGFSVVIETAQVRGEEYYRVVVGPEDSRAQADRLAGQLKRESYLKGDPFVRVVK